MANISVEGKRVLGIKNVIPARFGCTFKVDGEFIVFAQTIEEFDLIRCGVIEEPEDSHWYYYSTLARIMWT